MKKNKLVISHINKYLISIISIIFLYLFYLSIPTLYDKDRLQKDLSKKLLDKYKLNLSLSASINYLILPSPHFEIKDTKLFGNSNNLSKEIGQIKKLKVFISKRSLMKQDELKIEKIILNETNFSIQKEDLTFINDYINNIFSQKKIHIKNSNIFYKDNLNETVGIISIDSSTFFHNFEKSTNNIKLIGNFFNIPFKLDWEKNFSKKKNNKTLLSLNKLSLKMNNISNNNKQNYKGLNNLILGSQTKVITNYDIKKDLIELYSINSKFLNKEFNYNGKINLNPFNIELNFNLSKFDIQNLFKENLFFELLRSKLLFNKNFTGKIKFTSDSSNKNKLFDDSQIMINFKQGQIDFNNSFLDNENIGLLNLVDSELNLINNELIFDGSFIFKIKNKDKFYRIFQIPKKNRKKIEFVSFKLKQNLNTQDLFITKIKIDGVDANNPDQIDQILNNFSDDRNIKFKNWIDFKNFINLILENQFG